MILALATLPFHSPAQSPASPVEIRGGVQEEPVEPGRIAIRNLMVENRSSSTVELVEEVELPEGWPRVASADPVFQVTPGGRQMRLLTLPVPRSARSGRHTFTYRLKARRDGAVLASATLHVVVRPTGRLGLALSSRPGTVVAGDLARVTLSLVNSGNCPVQVSLDWTSSPEAPVEATARAVTLGPASARELTLEIGTDPALARPLLQLVQIKVSATWEGGGRSTLPAETLTFEVVPLTGSRFDPHIRLPVHLTTSAGWENGRDAGVQTELSGRGPVNDAGDRTLDFLFRSQDTAGGNGALRRREEQGVSYRSPLWDLHLGLRDFTVSPLTSAGGEGKGVRFDWHPGSSVGGIMISQGQDDSDPSRRMGAYVGKTFDGGLSLRGNVVRFEEGTPGQTRQIYSVQGGWTLTNRLSLDLEAGMDDSARSPSSGLGWRAEVRGLLGQAGAYSLTHAQAGPDFHGAINDSISTSASFYHPLTDRLRLVGSMRRHVSNPERNPARGPVSNEDLDWRAGLRYRAGNSTDLGLDYQNSRRRDTLLPAEHDTAEQSLRAGVTRVFGSLSLDLSQEIGIREDHLPGGSSRLSERTALSAFWSASEGQSYHATLAYGDSTPEAGAGKTMLASLGGGWRLTRTSSLGVDAAREVNDRTGASKDSLNARFDWQRSNGHRLAVTARCAREGTTRPPDMSVLVSYSIPLSVPIARKKGVGALQGSVVNADPGSHQPLSRVVVRLSTGETGVTDAAGRYAFQGLKPGDYSVSVDARSLGFGRVTADTVERTVRVERDSTTTFDITVLSAATLTVQLTVMAEQLAGSGTDAQPGGGTGMVGEVIEVTNGPETYRRQTGADGLAVFSNLRPGPWKLKTYDSALPANHVLERPERMLDLKAATRVTESVRALPRKRTLRLIDAGAVAPARAK